jgi:hypothetical protein
MLRTIIFGTAQALLVLGGLLAVLLFFPYFLWKKYQEKKAWDNRFDNIRD